MKIRTSIHFIINPISGNGQNKLTLDTLYGVFKKDKFSVKIKETERPNQATELAQQSISSGADIVVACGGDGTVNEVARCLVDSSAHLGIVPMGSGNGLASALKIPKNTTEALCVIERHKRSKIDVGEIEKHYFFSNTGIGFDANVINNYSRTKKREFVSYLKAVLLALLQPSPQLFVKIKTEADSYTLNPFLVFVSNSSKMGYDISLTPEASMQDGVLDAIIVPPLNKLEIIYFGILLLINKPHKFKKARYFLTKKLEITNLDKGKFLTQIDGESREIDSNCLNISVKKGALSVIIP